MTNRVHGLAGIGGEVDLQILDLEQRALLGLIGSDGGLNVGRHNCVSSTHAVRALGSSASCTASPSMMKASTVMASAADG